MPIVYAPIFVITISIATAAGQSSLYPGVSSAQDSLAKAAVRSVHAFDWDAARDLTNRMKRIERRRGLPPLSDLVEASAKVIRVKNGFYDSMRRRRRLVKDITEIAHAYRKSPAGRKDHVPDSLRSTYEFIRGGVLGYSATLKIHRAPVEALKEGFQAVGILRTLVSTDSSFADAYLGLGMFQCTVAKAPPLVTTALKILGASADLDTGLAYLRKASDHGCYARTVAQLYLVRFLSPFWGHLADEKFAILDSLCAQYPRNGYYAFLANEEALCFHPNRFYSEQWTETMARRRAQLSADNPTLHKYARLCDLQLQLARSCTRQSGDESPEHAWQTLGEFAYYPLFLWAVAQRHLSSGPLYNTHVAHAHKEYLRDLSRNAVAALRNSTMEPDLVSLYQWHIDDALRVDNVK